MSSNKNTFVALWISVLALWFASSANAQSWDVEPRVKVGAEYDDNATLDIRTDEEVSLSGLLVDLEAGISYSSATTTFSLQPEVLFRRYPDDSEFDTEDYFLQSEFSREGRSSEIGFRLSFGEESIRTAERATSDLDVEDPDELTDDDAGRGFLSFGDRTKWRFSPTWDYDLSNTSSIGATIDYYDVQYDDVFAGILEDYTDARLDLNYRRKFSDVNTGLLTVTGRRYDTDGTSEDTTGYGIMGGFQYDLSQKMQLMAMVGFEDSDQSGFDYDPEVTANVVLSRSLETIRMFAQYRRSVSASGAGRVSVRDSLNLNFRRRLNERISAGFGIRAYTSQDAVSDVSLEDRDYIQLQSSFRWYLSTAMIIEADYRYTVNDRSEDFGERSNANQVNLWFIYQPKTTPRL